MKSSWSLVLLCSSGIAAAVGNDHGGKTVHVYPGQSISKAIEDASKGDRIVVEAGEYKEQVLVKKPGIALIGMEGARIVPPEPPTFNDCSNRARPVFLAPDADTHVGICVAGEGIEFNPVRTPEHDKVLSVKKPVEGISVSGFSVSNFTGANIMLLGAKNAHVYNNELNNGPTYGIISSGSVSSLVSDNRINNIFGFVGICVDDLKDPEASRNTIIGHAVGLCIDTPEALIQNNDVSNFCSGAFVDPGVKGPKIIGNKLHNSYKCGGFAGTGSSGLIIDGGSEVEVRGNTIEEIRNDPGEPVAGLLIKDDPCDAIAQEFGLACAILKQPAVSINNRVTKNYFNNNDKDIVVDTAGAGNVIKNNQCSSGACLTLRG